MAPLWRTGSLALATILVASLLAAQPFAAHSSIQMQGVTIADVGFKDIHGLSISECADCDSKMVMLAANVSNNLNESQAFVAYLELRNADGIAVFSGLGIGTLGSNQSSEIALSWTPEESGEYQLRAFATDNSEDRDWISGVQNTTITIAGISQPS